MKSTKVVLLESLEDRSLFSAAVQVVAIVADNRGEVQIRVNKALQTGTVNRKSFRLFVGGPDGILNTPDDMQIPSAVSYDPATRTMTLRANVPADTNYRVKVYSSGIMDNEGLHLDGEYSGTYPSGNGAQSGNFEFRTKRDSSNLPTARITSSLGLITIRMNKIAAPATVDNFMAYANAGTYDGTIIHRNSRDEGGTIDVLQAGAIYSNFSAVPALSPIPLEAGLPNIRGSIAMARAADNGDVNQTATATSSFFLNETDNPELNPANQLPGWSPFGYAVFGTITSGLNVLDAIYALPTVDLTPSDPGSTAHAPVNGSSYVSFSRIAIQMKIANI